MKRTEIAETKLSHHAQLSRRGAARAALAACVIATFPAVGCRSGKPSWNMFGRSEPSAEVLAGSGPTTTYPSPPSARATPEAIASIAGGTTPETDKIAAAPETNAPATSANPYALAGDQVKTPTSGVPAGFPTGKVPPSDVPPTVSTTLAAGENAVPPAYALPGRSGLPASSDLAAAANGYGGVPAATPAGTTSASKPEGAGGLPSGYQLGKEPIANTESVADAKSAQAKASPAQNPSGSAFGMPPLDGMQAPAPSATAQASAPASSGGFGLPSDMIPPPAPIAAAAAPNSPANAIASSPTGAAGSPAVAALDLPPSSPSPLGNSTPNSSSPGGAEKTPAYQTASASKNSSGTGSGGSNDVQPAGYTPGSTGKSSGYPIMR
ncbi:hypothetical protein [Allorhodopirellula heiligendammensis]|uniref:Uncharacterized protein n=1 Tax=Allorhodopirellula heiligendammensis TaxID=2714739 RepID=A0A5C6BH52_9BACT|nr:hypothetical protein [Allorhodopirellula heiligendammensis]TWU10599.1 hypothetical protein Poly21_45050 [Allorhodopirellula heiligendammensis]